MAAGTDDRCQSFQGFVVVTQELARVDLNTLKPMGLGLVQHLPEISAVDGIFGGQAPVQRIGVQAKPRAVPRGI
jgi:hypothetical protein